jgi:hypothetical protein
MYFTIPAFVGFRYSKSAALSAHVEEDYNEVTHIRCSRGHCDS